MAAPDYRTKEYLYNVGTETRIRVQLELAERRTSRFAVALEVEWKLGDWRRAVCLDNWGGTVHRDRFDPEGRHRTRHEPIFDSEDVDLAVGWAQEHLADRREQYVREFRRFDASSE